MTEDKKVDYFRNLTYLGPDKSDREIMKDLRWLNNFHFCVNCDKLFESKNRDARYCNPRCHQQSRRNVAKYD